MGCDPCSSHHVPNGAGVAGNRRLRPHLRTRNVAKLESATPTPLRKVGGEKSGGNEAQSKPSAAAVSTAHDALPRRPAATAACTTHNVHTPAQLEESARAQQWRVRV
jgi:hypothetical protein